MIMMIMPTKKMYFPFTNLLYLINCTEEINNMVTYKNAKKKLLKNEFLLNPQSRYKVSITPF